MSGPHGITVLSGPSPCSSVRWCRQYHCKRSYSSSYCVVDWVTDLLVDGKWQRDGDGDQPDGYDQHETDTRLHARSERMNDHEVTVDSDRRGRQRRHVHTHAHRHRNEMAQRLAERPRLQQPGDGRERNGQQAHDDVRDGEVSDEDVGNWLHSAPSSDDVDDEAISGDTEDEDDSVERDEDDTEPRLLHDVVRREANVDGRRRLDSRQAIKLRHYAAGTGSRVASYYHQTQVSRPSENTLKTIRRHVSYTDSPIAYFTAVVVTSWHLPVHELWWSRDVTSHERPWATTTADIMNSLCTGHYCTPENREQKVQTTQCTRRMMYFNK